MPTHVRRVALLVTAAAVTGATVLAAGLAAPTEPARAAMPPRAGSAQAVPPPDSGWSLAWSDDFNGSAGSLPSSSNWIFDLGHSYPGGPANWGTGEIQNYTNSPSNISLDGSGNLRITPLRDGSGNWTSARIETQRTNFKPPDGGVMRIEGRIQMPNVTGNAALGYWPAFWALGSPYRGNYQNWPAIGEFDVMENVNGRDSVWQTLHCGPPVGGPCGEPDGISSGEQFCPGCRTSFHTYALELDRSVVPEQLRWYVDGRNSFTVNADRVDPATWEKATHHGFFIILNVAIGGVFPAKFGGGPTTATKSGVPMLVDRVAVFTSRGAS
jgi:beta-glucanase (GH16 family)